MDDCHVLYHFCSQREIPIEFGFCQKGGKDSAIRQVNALLVGSSLPEKIGIILDADTEGAHKRWQQISNKLEKYGYDFSQGPQSEGVILYGSSGYPDLGVWIMPDNYDCGILEDFLMNFAEYEGIRFAEQCVKKAVEKGFANRKPVHNAKSIIHTYLAWQDEPGEAMGRAVKKNILDNKSGTGNKLEEWICCLFS